MGYRIGIDVGGTFTDFVLVRASGSLELTKVPTTLPDQSLGVMQGIGRLAQGEELSTAELLAQTDAIVHGTTTADNTMIEMNGAVTGLLTTEGHRDEIEIRRGYKEDIWDPSAPPPIPIAPRRRRLGVPERLDFRGEVVTPLDEEAARRAIRRLKGRHQPRSGATTHDTSQPPNFSRPRQRSTRAPTSRHKQAVCITTSSPRHPTSHDPTPSPPLAEPSHRSPVLSDR